MKKLFFLILAVIGISTFNVNAQTINYTPKSLVKVSGESQGTDEVTLMLVKKSVTDLNNIIPSDIAYIAQTETRAGNLYDFNFKFTGDINNYNVLVRQSGKIINDTVKVAKTKLEAIDADIKITTKFENNITKAQIKAQIENYFVEDMSYKMMLAFYDIDDRLVDVDTVEAGTLKMGNESYTNSTPLPDNISKIKGFVWSDYQPLGVYDEISTQELAELPLKIYLVGDSICTDYGTELTDRVGWGTVFDDCFVEGITVENCAVRGASTKSYLTALRNEEEANANDVAWWWANQKKWDEIIADSSIGDYIIISLGANDRIYHLRGNETDYLVGTSIEDYKKNLETMIDEAHNKGVNIILTNTIAYYITSTYETQSIREYAEAVIEVAEKKNVIALDLNKKMYDYFTDYGLEAAQSKYFTSDRLHINQEGAQLVSDLISELLNETLSPLKNHIKE